MLSEQSFHPNHCDCCCWFVFIFFNLSSSCYQAISKKMTFDCKGRENSACLDLEAGVSLVCLRDRKMA